MYKAIDIVLLPPDDVMEQIIQINQKLSNKLRLNHIDCLPHISLAMGSIEVNDLGKFQMDLYRIACAHKQIRVKLNEFYYTGNSDTASLCLRVGVQDDLSILHESLIKLLGSYSDRFISKDMFFGDDQIDDSSLQWVQNYKIYSSFQNFDPHITIGYGQIALKECPLEFEVSKLAVCHLGNRCTCRQILLLLELQG